MQFRALFLAAATTVALVPGISQAATENNAVTACSRAFAVSVAAPGAPAPAFKLNYHGSVNTAVADYYARGFTFYLNARDPKTGAVVARATCSTDTHGSVIALLATPIDGISPTLTAQR